VTSRFPAAERVGELCAELVRIDTTNPGSPERPAADWAARLLSDAGADPVLLESEKGRASVVARIAGRNVGRCLLLHGHLDVGPAQPEGWEHAPFSGDLADGCVWGRGAVDMKGPIAMILATLSDRLVSARPPAHDVVIALVADEERGSSLGSRWLVEHRPDLLEGCTHAIGEVGGFSVTVAGHRIYLVQTAERGVAWTRIQAHGTGGHGSLIHTDNPIARIAEAVSKIALQEQPVRATTTNRALLAGLAETGGGAPGRDFTTATGSAELVDRLLDQLGPARRIVDAGLRNTANATAFEAGSSPNVVPNVASAIVDGRFQPGFESELDADIDAAMSSGMGRRDLLRAQPVEAPVEGDMIDSMVAAIRVEDPEGSVLPFTWPGFTDAKQFSRLGMHCYGFLPLRLPEDYDFAAMFHGPNERIPVASLEFGCRVLDRLLEGF